MTFQAPDNTPENAPEASAPEAAVKTAPLIEVDGLCHAYGDVEVLSDVTFTLSQGDCLALLGPNGGGKTTLLKLMVGLLRPRSGHLRYHGLTEESIGYVPQQMSVSTMLPVSVRDVVMMGGLQKGILQRRIKSHDRDRAAELMQQLGILELAERRFDRLSGGQKQRALIARALFSDPELLIFDEPIANVDTEGRYCFHELLSELSGQKTIVVVSHDFSLLSAGVNRLAGVNKSVCFSPDVRLTPEILALTYGHHHRSDCPVDAYMREMAAKSPEAVPPACVRGTCHDA